MDQTRYAQRRATFMERLGDTIAIVPAGRHQARNGDVAHAFRQNSDFFFLTGFPEPESVAIFDPSHPTEQYTLFVRPRDPEMESWNGRRAGVDGAVEQYAANAAHTLDELDEWLRRRLVGRSTIGYTHGSPGSDRVLDALKTARAHSRRAGVTTPETIIDPRAVLHEMRLYKSSEEIEALRKACHISAVAHTEAMRFTRPGLNERQVQAAVEYVFAVMGAERVGYGSIVAGGPNATILHYVENDQPLQDGELLLIDAGAEYRHLTADITRTFPVNGEFTAAQRALYELVLDAERQVIDVCAPGLAYSEMHEKAVDVLSHGLVDLGLLPGSGDEAIEKGWYREFFFHGTGHWLGIDVHDAGAYKIDGEGRKLEPSMTFTVEPGIYVAPEKTSVALSNSPYDPQEAMRLSYELGAAEAKAEFARRTEEAGSTSFEVPAEFLGIGIRVEDDILITSDGHENLSSGVPTGLTEIEAICGEDSDLPLFS
ncbi:MAG: aminopeptidase P N-terminal domain-containing protein [Actinomycetota bacterium]|nr:aminopeptidase P N-terminal domain-containing protein [Actinomycetota bacterium]